MAELVLALDLPSGLEALRLLDRLPALRWAKVGPVLMTREGPALLRELSDRGLQVFLDLKWHDIPNTVRGAVAAARESAVAMATVHTLGGREMMAAAVEAAGDRLGLVGVTVLTSHTASSYAAATGRTPVDLGAEVVRQAGHAMAAGLRGVVCSPREVAAVRTMVGQGGWVVVPGIRRPNDAGDDQSRTAGPSEAVAAGATHLVIGRPITAAADPAGALSEFLAAMG